MIWALARGRVGVWLAKPGGWSTAGERAAWDAASPERRLWLQHRTILTWVWAMAGLLAGAVVAGAYRLACNCDTNAPWPVVVGAFALMGQAFTAVVVYIVAVQRWKRAVRRDQVAAGGSR